MSDNKIAFFIVICFGLIAFGIFGYTNGFFDRPVTHQSLLTEVISSGQSYGESDATITVVEFSDVECPFCAQLHPTLKQLVDESEGKVKWVYAHLPLSIHPNAYMGAVALECVGQLATTDIFWSYMDDLLSNNRNLSMSFYKERALSYGIEADEFDDCLLGKEVKSKVETDIDIARKLGATGTPFSVLIHGNGKIQSVPGALPLDAWKELLNNLETTNE